METRTMQTDTDNFIREIPVSAPGPRPAAAQPTVACGECGHRFVTTVVTERTPGGGEQWHFLCPHCGHRYDVCRISAQGVELRHQLESVKAQLRLAPQRTDLAEKRDDLLAKLAAEITDLTTPPKPE